MFTIKWTGDDSVRVRVNENDEKTEIAPGETFVITDQKRAQQFLRYDPRFEMVEGVFADDKGKKGEAVKDLKAQLEAVVKENEELKARLAELEPAKTDEENATEPKEDAKTDKKSKQK